MKKNNNNEEKVRQPKPTTSLSGGELKVAAKQQQQSKSWASLPKASHTPTHPPRRLPLLDKLLVISSPLALSPSDGL